jgi:hypothetical protein
MIEGMKDEKNERIGYSLKELAAQLPLSIPFLRLEIKRGELVATPFGDRVVIMKVDRDDYVRRQREKALAKGRAAIAQGV